MHPQGHPRLLRRLLTQDRGRHVARQDLGRGEHEHRDDPQGHDPEPEPATDQPEHVGLPTKKVATGFDANSFSDTW